MDWDAESKLGESRVRSIVEDYKVVEPYSGSLWTETVLAKGPADDRHLDVLSSAYVTGSQTARQEYMTEQSGRDSKQTQAIVLASPGLGHEESWS
jgi:hypothetical protein